MYRLAATIIHAAIRPWYFQHLASESGGINKQLEQDSGDAISLKYEMRIQHTSTDELNQFVCYQLSDLKGGGSLSKVTE